MNEYLRYSLEILGVILITDFLSGLFHWLEDSYGRPDWPITGRLVTQPNIVHHCDPRYFAKHTWLRSADVLLAIGVIILVIAVLADALTWHLALLLALGINANEFHKWAHQSAQERPRIATWLQSARILQTPAHHVQHHSRGKDTHYCVLTNFVNPVLDKLRFWRILEVWVITVFGVKKREDASRLERPWRTGRAN